MRVPENGLGLLGGLLVAKRWLGPLHFGSQQVSQGERVSHGRAERPRIVFHAARKNFGLSHDWPQDSAEDQDLSG